ncbi:hypothetical protein SODALDRAFT_33250 [Sodiomyces alkalinus F11]|uniref:Heat shock factor binding protein 1 n=1 Tax=Sodiomyces alkalinus (strain CBS 110278 / VKM F-3762 / F11) TaxID=1314773 RepID=A0A3N2Q990_SODAK|nr:hypothetical protein SODALDRAFT_33250 [Sodiomyces alkalinus F11]ROT43195.1 hypothetical protein SODALDRAFT_33250 [Sodiomyces alkalinus F11]
MATNNPDSNLNQGSSSLKPSSSFLEYSGIKDSEIPTVDERNLVHVLTTFQSNEDTKAADVNAAVEELLNTLSNKFAGISSEIFAKMDEMSRRLDNLEAALLADKGKEGDSNSSQNS